MARVASTIGVASGYITKAKVLWAGSRIISITRPKRAFATSSAAAVSTEANTLTSIWRLQSIGQLEQPQGVAGRRGVEDRDVERVAAGELDELVERRHLLGARRVELLAHRGDRLGAPSAGHRVGDDPVRVRDRRRLGVDAGRPEPGRRPSTGAGSVPTAAPRTCPMWAAGSVVTSSVR